MLRSLVPFRDRFPSGLSKVEQEMADMMERFFGSEDWPSSRFAPEVNVAETETGYEVTADLPGLKPSEVSVELKDDSLWISGEKVEEKEEKDKTFHRVERRTGKFRRVIPLPGAVEPEKVDARFEQGVLKITVPKGAQSKSKRIPVQG